MNIDRLESLDKRRSKVFLDGKFAFVLYQGELKRYHIAEGAQLSEEKYREILEQILFKRTRERALYILKFSSRTELELRSKLKTGFHSEEAIEKAIEFLKEYHLLDDQEYARNYIELYRTKKSRKEIYMVLQKKGIDKEEIRELLEEYVSEQDEEQKIRILLEKRRYKGSDASIEEKKKDVAFLMRKGFPYEVIRRIMGEIKSMESDC